MMSVFRVRSLSALRPSSFGDATLPSIGDALALRGRDDDMQWRATQVPDYPPIVLNGEQAWSAAQGFRMTLERSGCIIVPCAVLPNQSHLVPLRHRNEI